MDVWEEGRNYECYMGRWSRLVAQEFLTWLQRPLGSSWLDVGCGTGAMTRVIAEIAQPQRVAGVDPSPGFVDAARQSLGSTADLRVGDAQSLPFGADEFDTAVSGLVLNFVPDPVVAVREMQRVTRLGGVVAAYVWDYADGMQMIRRFWDTAIALDPPIGHLDEAVRFSLCQPDRLADLFDTADLDEIETAALEVPMVFEGFDEFWRPFLGGQGPAPSYVRTLSDSDRQGIVERLRAAVSASREGPLALSARAWGVKGIVTPSER